MKNLLLVSVVLYWFVVSCFGQENSYEKDWILQDREKAKRLAEGDEPNSGDIVMYPSRPMKSGKGFSNGLGKVTVNGKAGFINANGRIVIKTKFIDVGHFPENLAPVEIKNGKWGFINTQGKWVIKPQFNWAFSFRDERALVQVGEKWGYIDTTGKFAVKAQFDEANSFSDGVAVVGVLQLANVAGHPKDFTILKSGYIDKNGKWIIQPTLDGGGNFYNGVANASQNLEGSLSYQDIFWIDKTGKKVFSHDKYDPFINWFSNGLLVVKKDNLYGAVDETGKEIIPIKFNELNGFSEGLSYFRLEGESEGYIDRTGKIVIELKSVYIATDFSEGLAAVSIETKNKTRNDWGYINKTGEFVIKPQFEWAWEFQEGIALIAEGDKTGYIDRNGKYIWKPTK